MKEVKKRLKLLELAKKNRERVWVMFAVLVKEGKYLWRGKVYNKTKFDTLVKQLKPKTIIIDDIPRRIEENE